MRVCLEDKLLHSLEYTTNSSCDKIMTFGYQSHSHCYVDGGFCHLVLPDKQNLNALYMIVSIRDLVWPPGAIKAICDILNLCRQVDTNQNSVCEADETSGGGCNKEKVTGFIPHILTWITQIAGLVCNLYSS